MRVEVEPSLQQFVSFVGVRQIAAEAQPDKMASDVEVCTKLRCHSIPPRGKILHSFTFNYACWNSGCEHSEAMGGAFQQWRQWWNCTELNVRFNAMKTRLAALKYSNVCARLAPRMLIQEHKNTECKSRTCWPGPTRRTFTWQQCCHRSGEKESRLRRCRFLWE
jgi:hypothetical protein